MANLGILRVVDQFSMDLVKKIENSGGCNYLPESIRQSPRNTTRNMTNSGHCQLLTWVSETLGRRAIVSDEG